LARGQSVEVGSLKLTVIHTPGHAPGGTSWRWQSCEAGRCLNMVYSDSLNAVSDDAFKYSGDPRYPTAAKELTSSIEAIAAAPCDVLITAHPEQSGIWEVIDEQGKGDRAKLIDATVCQRYGEGAKQRFEQRLTSEKEGKQ
jgi:metallo-beta-lactamase class B